MPRCGTKPTLTRGLHEGNHSVGLGVVVAEADKHLIQHDIVENLYSVECCEISCESACVCTAPFDPSIGLVGIARVALRPNRDSSGLR